MQKDTFKFAEQKKGQKLDIKQNINFWFSQLDVLTQILVMSNTATPHELSMLLSQMEGRFWSSEKWPTFKKAHIEYQMESYLEGECNFVHIRV